MVEVRRGSDPGPKSPERLPWLEPVEDEDYGERRGFGGVALAVVAVLLVVAVVTGATIWWRHRAGQTADLGQVLRAPADPYKIKPADAGGMKPAAEGEVAYGTSAGQDIDSPIDLGAVPEEPVTPGAPRAPTPAPQPAAPAARQVTTPASPPPAPAPAPARLAAADPKAAPAASTPAPAPAPAVEPGKGGGGTVQLGAFSSQAKATAAWKSLSRRYTYLADLAPAVVPVQSGEAMLYRLRAGGGALSGAQLCGRLRVAGESCAVVSE